MYDLCGCLYVNINESAQLYPTLCNTTDLVHGIFWARILEWVAFPFSRGSFQPRGSNPSFPHCRQILYQLSHKGSPRILEWVAYPFSRESSWLRNQTMVSCIAGRYFTNWVILRSSNKAPGTRGLLLGEEWEYKAAIYSIASLSV